MMSWLSLQLGVSVQLLPWALAAAGTQQLTIREWWNTSPLPRRLFLSEAAKGYYWLESHCLWARGKYSLEQWNKQMTLKCIICYIGICFNISQSNFLLHTSNAWDISSYSCSHEVQDHSATEAETQEKKARFKLMKWWNALCCLCPKQCLLFSPHYIICPSIYKYILCLRA